MPLKPMVHFASEKQRDFAPMKWTRASLGRLASKTNVDVPQPLFYLPNRPTVLAQHATRVRASLDISLPTAFSLSGDRPDEQDDFLFRRRTER